MRNVNFHETGLISRETAIAQRLTLNWKRQMDKEIRYTGERMSCGFI